MSPSDCNEIKDMPDSQHLHVRYNVILEQLNISEKFTDGPKIVFHLHLSST